MISNKLHLGMFISCLCMICACSNPVLYSYDYKIPNNLWTESNALHFEWDVADTNQLYNLILNVKHDLDYDYQNVYVQFETGFPDSSKKEQLLSLELFNADGRPQGKCGKRSCLTNISLGEKLAFPQIGKYYLNILPSSRDSIITQIESLELRIEAIK